MHSYLINFTEMNFLDCGMLRHLSQHPTITTTNYQHLQNVLSSMVQKVEGLTDLGLG